MIAKYFAALRGFLINIATAVCEALAEVYDDHDGYKP